MPIHRWMLLLRRFAIISIVAALAQAPAAIAANIFVAKLNFATSSDDLRATFEQFGTVSSAKVIMDHVTGKSRGYGFVEMPDEQEARTAIAALNESDFDGNTIVVKLAEPREFAGAGTARPAGGFGGGGSVRPAGGLGGGGGLGPPTGLDSSPKPPTPTPTAADVPAAGDAAADETSSSEAHDDAEVDAELDALDADSDTADEAMDDGEAELDAGEDLAEEEEESDGDESAEVDDAEVDETLDAADETDESGDEHA